ncbi:hypothetical protein RJ639_013059 [Escallonia herrerae]|uniref:Uncharacterized protein n=1 Tax=Escallonia herrerae TaxID=1293975 RepID=A0AA88VH48_9ASTE|nr:hypothetical protein RJ639_013059 [Escallonia herrerae]
MEKGIGGWVYMGSGGLVYGCVWQWWLGVHTGNYKIIEQKTLKRGRVIRERLASYLVAHPNHLNRAHSSIRSSSHDIKATTYRSEKCLEPTGRASTVT